MDHAMVWRYLRLTDKQDNHAVPKRRRIREILKNDERYISAFRKNETQLHSFLKFIARLWLEENIPERHRIKFNRTQYEMKIYFPDDEYINKLNLNVVGTSFDIRRSQIVENGQNGAIASFGSIIVADVFGRGVSIEVGYTQPYNLCMPFLEYLANKSIWLPFPSNLKENEFELNNINFEYVTAYEISIIEE